MRCLAIAEEMESAGWRIVFATGSETTATVPALAAAGFDLEVLSSDKDEPRELARRFVPRSRSAGGRPLRARSLIRARVPNVGAPHSGARRCHRARARLRSAARCRRGRSGALPRPCAGACAASARAGLRDAARSISRAAERSAGAARRPPGAKYSPIAGRDRPDECDLPGDRCARTGAGRRNRDGGAVIPRAASRRGAAPREGRDHADDRCGRHGRPDDRSRSRGRGGRLLGVRACGARPADRDGDAGRQPARHLRTPHRGWRGVECRPD